METSTSKATKTILLIGRDQASDEVNGWLDKKKIYESTREAQKESVELLIEAIMAGDLTLDTATNEFTHKLLFPFEGLTEIKYKARLNDNILRPHLNGVKPSDADGRLNAYTSALTNVNKKLLTELDTADKKIMMSIAVFFL